jgi:mannose-1-phosphate guanylyltransferase
MAPLIHDPDCAALILAGGEGIRLSSFIREVFGYHIPKQFCLLFGGKTLLEKTLHRVSLLVPLSQTTAVLNCAHECFYSAFLGGTATGDLFIQPENRGTAPAILGALLRLIERGHTGAVAIFPSDHYVSDDSIFMRHVSAAFRAVDHLPQLIVLLGITPVEPETEYGWIEPGAPVVCGHALAEINHIRRFWEKPLPEIARQLYDRRYYWNSFVLVAKATTLLSLTARALPDLYQAISRIRSFVGAKTAEQGLRAVYRDLPTVDFCGRVLAEFPTELAVLPVAGVGWSDLGDPKRLLAVISSRDNRRVWPGGVKVRGNQDLVVRGGPKSE